MSELAINSAQVWTKLQKRLGNNTSFWLSPAEKDLLTTVIDAGGTIAEQVGKDTIGPGAEVVLDIGGPFEWSVSTNCEVVLAVPAATINVAIAVGDQTPEICQRVAEELKISVGDILFIRTRSGANVISSEIVLSAIDGTDITVTSITLT